MVGNERAEPAQFREHLIGYRLGLDVTWAAVDDSVSDCGYRFLAHFKQVDQVRHARGMIGQSQGARFFTPAHIVFPRKLALWQTDALKFSFQGSFQSLADPKQRHLDLR